MLEQIMDVPSRVQRRAERTETEVTDELEPVELWRDFVVQRRRGVGGVLQEVREAIDDDGLGVEMRDSELVESLGRWRGLSGGR